MMNKKISISGLAFGLVIFVGLMPLAFKFSGNQTQLLLGTSFKYFIWSAQAIVLLTLFFTKINFSKNQLIGLAMLCTLVPFIFAFTEIGISFLILNNVVSSMLSWAIASVLFAKWFVVLDYN
ncbi:MAG: hypothetical protein IPM36_11630 [Lewinellaceae bacterium]|nr:hypothetical protein [Lewinellaceae bacterium]